ncbi:hypothetical protein [Rhodovulum euryhalinum]|nr:hypothetical protein [Rhodovulum euryhalinum]
MPTKEELETLDRTGHRFGAALERWGQQAERTAMAQGAPGQAMVINRLRRRLLVLTTRLWRRIMLLAEQFGLFDLAGEVGAFVEMGIDELLGALEEVLDTLETAGTAAADVVVGAMLGIVEAIKKAIHLVLDRVKLPPVTEPIEAMLDLLDNLIGNIAELVSPKAGAMARTFRSNMYGQLADIRAARAGFVIQEADRKDPGRGATSSP